MGMVSDPHGFLSGVHPVLRDFAHYCASQVKFDLRISSGYRSPEEQAKLYAQGRTAPGAIVTQAAPGQSAHNYGLAIDLYPYSNGKIATDDKDPRWAEIILATRTFRSLHWHGSKPVNVESGQYFGDKPHVQVQDWQGFKDWKKTPVASGSTGSTGGVLAKIITGFGALLGTLLIFG